MVHNYIKKLIIPGLTCIVTLFFCGVFRHDSKTESYLELAKEEQFNCVGKVLKNGKTLGSAVLINSKYLLTAAHLFDHSPYNTQSTTSIINVQFEDQKHLIKSVVIHPQYRTKGYDLAIIELSSVVKTVPAVINTSFDELRSVVTGVGFGESGTIKANGYPNEMFSERKTAGRNVIDSLGGKTFNNNQTVLIMDFDSPNPNAINRLGDSKPQSLEYTPCGGDSGGGLFRIKNGKWQLLGICSSNDADIEGFRKYGYYGSIANWTRVSAFKDWIESTAR